MLHKTVLIGFHSFCIFVFNFISDSKNSVIFFMKSSILVSSSTASSKHCSFKNRFAPSSSKRLSKFLPIWQNSSKFVSPSPKTVYRIFENKSFGKDRFFIFLQNWFAFSGASPFPVVEQTTIILFASVDSKKLNPFDSTVEFKEEYVQVIPFSNKLVNNCLEISSAFPVCDPYKIYIYYHAYTIYYILCSGP